MNLTTLDYPYLVKMIDFDFVALLSNLLFSCCDLNNNL